MVLKRPNNTYVRDQSTWNHKHIQSSLFTKHECAHLLSLTVYQNLLFIILFNVTKINNFPSSCKIMITPMTRIEDIKMMSLILWVSDILQVEIELTLQ